jgi:alpha-ketoglutarate-dependent taurine dioxygenase
MPGIKVQPVDAARPELGALVSDVDLADLSEADFRALRETLYRYSVVCLKGQSKLTPKQQAELTRRFDPGAASYGHGKTIDAKRSILHPDLKTVPHQPEVQVIGNGFVEEYEGLKNITLKHPHHKTFHKTVIPDDRDLDFTRFYRWHIDAALYGDLHPPMVTSLLAVKVPSGRTQTLVYDDGSDDSLQVPLGTTAFVSGYTMFDRLTPEQRQFALSSKVEYAPHPYVWISTAKSRSTGLGMVSEGKEVPVDELPEIDARDVQIHPMVWRNPVTGRLALQIHPSVVRKIHLADGTVVDDLERVRDIVHDLQRPGIAPELVYPHDWEEGDLVLFNNHGVLHSVVGAFDRDEVRLFRQCNLAASRPPYGPDEVAA